MGDTRQQYGFRALYLCRVTREEEARLPNLLKTCPDKVMAISYTLVQRKDMSKGALEDAKLYYALAVNTRRVDFDDLCDEIAETCTLTSADIKAVLDRVIWAMVSHLKNSELVQFGDLGNFRISVGSTGSATPEEFSASMLRKPKVVFHPGKRLQEMRDVAKFARYTVDKDDGAEGGGV